MIRIDMPIPTNCLDCPACNEYLTCAIPVNGRKWGENDVHEFGQGRPEWCPMKEQEPALPTWSQGKAYCGKCGQRLPRKRADRETNYCSCCGQAVKWE